MQKRSKPNLAILATDVAWAKETAAWLEFHGIQTHAANSVKDLAVDALLIDRTTARQLSELRELGGSLGEIVARLRADVSVLERIHQKRLPRRFPKIRGISIESRYLVGEAAGGDHFDVAESKSSSRVSLLMTDASTYGLAGAILDVIIRVAMKLSADELKHADQFVKQIYEEVTTTLGAKDRLSVVYGLLSRADHQFEYVAVGSHRLYHATGDDGFRALPRGADPIPLASKDALGRTGSIQLAPKDRLLLVSDGFVEGLGGDGAFLTILNEIYLKQTHREAGKGLTELVFELKKTLKSDDDIPKQDCSAMWVELDSNVRRIA